MDVIFSHVGIECHTPAFLSDAILLDWCSTISYNKTKHNYSLLAEVFTSTIIPPTCTSDDVRQHEIIDITFEITLLAWHARILFIGKNIYPIVVTCENIMFYNCKSTFSNGVIVLSCQMPFCQIGGLLKNCMYYSQVVY